MIIQIPFSGFYNSIHDEQLDYELNNGLFTDYATGCNNNDNLSNHAYDAMNWRELHLDYSREYAEDFASQFELKIKFESLSSPREYNFTTDRIFCTIDDSEVMRLWHETKPEIMTNQVKTMFTSYDGFCSHYSSDFNEWGASPLEYDHNELYCLLLAWVSTNYDAGKLENVEYSFIDYKRGDGFFYELLYKHCNNKRLFTIHEYLNKRAERV